MNEIIKKAQDRRVKVSYSIPESIALWLAKKAKELDVAVSVVAEAYLSEGINAGKKQPKGK